MKWLASEIRCEICTHNFTAVYPAECDEGRLECPSCGYQTGKVIQRIKPDNPPPKPAPPKTDRRLES